MSGGDCVRAGTVGPRFTCCMLRLFGVVAPRCGRLITVNFGALIERRDHRPTTLRSLEPAALSSRRRDSTEYQAWTIADVAMIAHAAATRSDSRSLPARFNGQIRDACRRWSVRRLSVSSSYIEN